MSEAALRELLSHERFHPFTIHLSDGKSYEVRHPENMLVTKSRVIIAFPEIDKVVIAALLHVTSVSMLQSA